MDFLKFLLENKEKINKIASENGKYDSEGRLLLSKDDDDWNEDYEEGEMK